MSNKKRLETTPQQEDELKRLLIAHLVNQGLTPSSAKAEAEARWMLILEDIKATRSMNEAKRLIEDVITLGVVSQVKARRSPIHPRKGLEVSGEEGETLPERTRERKRPPSIFIQPEPSESPELRVGDRVTVVSSPNALGPDDKKGKGGFVREVIKHRNKFIYTVELDDGTLIHRYISNLIREGEELK